MTAFVGFGSGCISDGNERERDGYIVASPALEREIHDRIDNLRYLHGSDLYASMKRLQRIGEPALPALYEALESEDAKTRGSIAFVLGEVGDPRAVSYLQPVASDPVENVRLEAACSLVILGDWPAMEVLIEALRHPKESIRQRAFDVLQWRVKTDFGYNPQGSEAERAEAVVKWEEWWQKAKGEELL